MSFVIVKRQTDVSVLTANSTYVVLLCITPSHIWSWSYINRTLVYIVNSRDIFVLYTNDTVLNNLVLQYIQTQPHLVQKYNATIAGIKSEQYT